MGSEHGITQHMMQAFTARHILGQCNWAIEAASAAMAGDAPDWSPIGNGEAEQAWADMRTCHASLWSPSASIDYRAEGNTLARARLESAELAVEYEGSPQGARDLAEQVRELADTMHMARDEEDTDSNDWDVLDYAGDVLSEYADDLESAADDPDEPDVMQAFTVSDWLGGYLRDRCDGEGVVRDDDGNFIWLRQCCGQATWKDSCIDAAAREWYGAHGTGPRQWTRYAYAMDRSGQTLLDAAIALLRDPYLADPINNDRMGPLREAIARIEVLASGACE